MRTERSMGFQATRKPTGMGEGTRMGVSAGSSAEAARLIASARARIRTLPTISAVRPSRANRLEDCARHEMREIAARAQGRAHLGGGDGKGAPRHLDDARQLRDAIESLP